MTNNSSNCAGQTESFVYISSYLTLFSSCLSIFGSSLIILTFILWKDVRQSVARIILLFLALADLGTGLGYLISSTGFIINHHYSSNHSGNDTGWYSNFCTGTSFFTTFFPVSSFFWTAYLAIYFFVTLVLVKPGWGRKLLIVFNLTAWPIPLLICVIAVSFGVLGQSNHLTSAGWCFVALNGTNPKYPYHYGTYLLLEAVIGKMWELIFFIVVGICYGAIFYVNRKCSCIRVNRRLSRGLQTGNSISIVDWKLFLIPVVFILLRLPGVYRYILSITPPCFINDYKTNNVSCVPHECFIVGGNYYFLFLQAFCGPLQGFGNAVLFVFLSKHIMKRLTNLLFAPFKLTTNTAGAKEGYNPQVDTNYSTNFNPSPPPPHREQDNFYVRYSPALPRCKTPDDKHPLLHDSSMEVSSPSIEARIHYGSVPPRPDSCTN